jgi:tetratricopeptide (TPR) repeat protein
MEFFQKLFGGGDVPNQAADTALNRMKQAMDSARYARRAESYEQAYEALENAMEIAEAERDTHSVTVIALHQADILIDQGRYDEAETLLSTVQQAAESVNQRGFVAYALTSVANLHAKREEWDDARQNYEQARDVAQKVNADGPEGRAMGHLADVYLRDNNAAYAIHLLEEALPKLNNAGDLEMSSYFVGRLGEAMRLSGQPAEGRAMLDRALRLAQQMRDTRMIRRWTVALGDCAYEDDHYDEAYTHYTQSLDLLDAETPSQDRARVLARLSGICLGLGELDIAVTHAESAWEIAESLDDDALRSEARGALGLALRANNRDAEAVPHLEAAVARSSDTVDALYIASLRNLAAAQLAAGDPDQARATYERTLEQARSAELTLPLAETLRDYALLHNKTGDPRRAIELWTEALEMFEDAHDNTQIARILVDLANTRRSLGATKRAMNDYEKALVSLNHVDDAATRGLVLANAANAYTDQGDTESASAFFKESIDIARQTADPRAEATRLGNYGWFLTGIGQPRKAIERLTEALEISKREGYTLQAAVQTDNLGLAYDTLSQYKTALGYHEEALALIASLEPVPLRWQALFEANAARSKLSLGFVAEATELASSAVDHARAANDFEAVIIALLSYGRSMLRGTTPEAAEQHIKEALVLSQRASLRRLQAEAYHLYSEQQAAVGGDAARAHWDQARKLYHMVGAPAAKNTPFWVEGNEADAPAQNQSPPGDPTS